MSSPAEPQFGGPPSESDFDLLSYWRVVRKHRWLIAAVFAGVVALGSLWTLRQVKVYEATASLDIEQSAPQVLGNGVQDVVDMPGSYWFVKEFYETQYKMITSRAVARRVIDRLGLASNVQFLGLEGVQDKDELERALRTVDPVAVLQSRIRVEPVKESRLVYLRVQDSDPTRAALYANSLAQAYLDQVAEQRLEQTRGAADWLQGQVGDLKTKLESSELALYNYKRENDILSMSLEDQQNTISQKVRTLSDEITRTQTKKILLEAQVDQVRALKERGEKQGEFSEDGFPSVVQSSLIQNLKEAYFKQKAVVAELSERYESKHPHLLGAQRQLEVARQQIQGEIQQILQATETEYRQTVAAEAGLKKLLESVRREAFEVNKKDIDYKKLDRESTNNQRLYDLVLKRLKETDLSVLLKTSNVHLLDPAIVPKVPIRPNLRLNALVLLVFGLVGGLGLAFLLEKLDNTLKSQLDIERILQLPFLGVLPTIIDASVGQSASEENNVSRDLFVHTHPRSAVAECCRSIRTNLLFMSPDRPLKRLLVTSSGPQEGKTTTAVSLGIAMAQSGSRTLLIDTDMRKPRLHRAFGVSNEIGLSTAVVGETQIDQCIKTTAVGNLWVLPCGPIPPNPAEMLHTERFREILKKLEERFDRLVFDSPPLALVADAAVLSTQVDGSLLVVKAGQTTREVALSAVTILASVKANIVGVILNNLHLEGDGYYYYYRGSYYGEEQDSQAVS